MNVGDWLAGLGLGDFAAAFAENGVEAELLAELTNEDLKDLGVARLADRKRLLKAIGELSDGEAAPAVAEAAPSPSGERRQVTVLFADISGFTRLSSELDAEETHALLNRYFEIVDDLVETYGGRIDKHIGDNVMAVFGAPLAHTDDPERAVRAALEIHESLAGSEAAFGRALRAHIGIASGQVVASGTGSAAHREYTVTGDTVNLASRLQDLARPGETLISQSVRNAVSRLIAGEAHGEVSVKGLEGPVRVWRLDRLVEAPPDHLTAFVGRRAELAQFTALLDETGARGKGHGILVRGEAGLGKTRLVGRFADIAAERGFVVHRALVLDFGVGRGQDAIGALARSLLGLPMDAEEARRRAAAEDAVSIRGFVPDDKRVFLNDLLDLPQPAELQGLFDAMDTSARETGRQETLSALVVSVAATGPRLLVIEDLHWADRATFDLFAGLASAIAAHPVLLVATSRIEGRTLEPGWVSTLRGSPLTSLELQPLAAEEAMALARDLAGADASRLEAYVARAEGNPLFLEQLTHNASDPVEAELPDTLKGLVLARVDRLSERDRVALQAASVIGQRFGLETLSKLTGDPDFDCGNLIRHRLVRPEGPDYLFAHALIREGVYGSLLRARRRELHGKAAEHFSGRDAVLHAEHLDRAGAAEAPRAYLLAAREQAGGLRHEQALALVRRAIEIGPGADAFALACLEGELLRDLGSVSESVAACRRAIPLADEDSGRCRALIGLAEGLRLGDQHGELLETLGRAQALAAARGLAPQLARIYQLRGSVYFIRGELDDCLRANRASLEKARAAGSPELEAQALSGLGDAEFARGRMISAHGHFDRCIELSRAHGLSRVLAANLSMRGQTLLYRNELAAALDDCREAVELAAKIRQARAEMIGAIVAAYVLEPRGSGEAGAWAEAGLDIARRLGAGLFESINLEYLGRSADQKGERSEARRLLLEALAIIRESESGMRFLGARELGALALVTDDPEERRSALREGEDLLLGGTPGAHNFLWFYRDAMEVSLRTAEWDAAERYAAALEAYAAAEPLPWSDFFTARARALAAFARGKTDAATLQELRRLRAEAAQVGQKTALPALDAALAAG